MEIFAKAQEPITVRDVSGANGAKQWADWLLCDALVQITVSLRSECIENENEKLLVLTACKSTARETALYYGESQTHTSTFHSFLDLSTYTCDSLNFAFYRSPMSPSYGYRSTMHWHSFNHSVGNCCSRLATRQAGRKCPP